MGIAVKSLFSPIPQNNFINFKEKKLRHEIPVKYMKVCGCNMPRCEKVQEIWTFLQDYTLNKKILESMVFIRSFKVNGLDYKKFF